MNFSMITKLRNLLLVFLTALFFSEELHAAGNYLVLQNQIPLETTYTYNRVEKILSEGSVVLSRGDVDLSGQLVSYYSDGNPNWMSDFLDGYISSVKVAPDEQTVYATAVKESITVYSSELYAIDNREGTGSPLWHKELYAPGPYKNSAVIEEIFPNGNILVSAGTMDASDIYNSGIISLYSSSGTLLKEKTDFGGKPNVMVSPDKKRIYVTVMTEVGSKHTTTLYAFDDSLTALGTRIIYALSDYSSEAYTEGILSNGMLVISGGINTAGGISGKIEAVDPSNLSIKPGWPVTFTDMPTIKLSRDKNTIYAVFSKGAISPANAAELYALTVDGGKKWSQPIYDGKAADASSIDDLLSDGTVIVHAGASSISDNFQTYSDKVSAFDGNGSKKWENYINARIISVTKSSDEKDVYITATDEIKDTVNNTSAYLTYMKAVGSDTGNQSWLQTIYPQSSNSSFAKIEKVLPDGNVVLTTWQENSSGTLEIYQPAGGDPVWYDKFFYNAPDLMISSDNFYMCVADQVSLKFFSKMYGLSVKKLGSGQGNITSTETINCGEVCAQSYETSKTVTLTATPSLHSSFVGWSDPSCIGTTCVVDVNVLRNVTATFNVNSYQFKVTLKGKGKVTSSLAGISCGKDCTEKYTANTKVTLKAKPSSGHKFVKWSGGGCSGKKTTCAVTMDSARTVTAVFK